MRTVFAERLGRGEGTVLRCGFGLDFDLKGEAASLLALDHRALERALHGDAEGVSSLLLGEGDDELFASLEVAVDVDVDVDSAALQSSAASGWIVCSM